MNGLFNVRKADISDIKIIQKLIKNLAEYEKRPQDMTATDENLCYWIFEKKIATVLIAQYDEEIIGYAIYYPVFGSFAGEAGVHLEDFLLKEEQYVKTYIIYFRESGVNPEQFRCCIQGGGIHYATGE